MYRIARSQNADGKHRANVFFCPTQSCTVAAAARASDPGPYHGVDLAQLNLQLHPGMGSAYLTIEGEIHEWARERTTTILRVLVV